MKMLRYVGATAIGAGVLASTWDASALDPAIRRAEAAGSVCRQVGTIGTPVYNFFGTVRNDSTTQMLQLDCPIPFLLDTSYGDQVDVSIYATGNGNGAIGCTVYVEKLSPTPSSPTYYSAATGSDDVGALELTVDVNVFENSSYGVMHVACNLPPKTGSSAAAIRGFVTKD